MESRISVVVYFRTQITQIEGIISLTFGINICEIPNICWSNNISRKVGDGFEDNLEVEKVLLRFHIPKLLRHVGGDFPIYKFNTGSAIFIA